MAKRQADVNLVISATNLAKKDLKEIGALLDTITDAQNKQASSAELASKSIGELKAQQHQLAAALRELERREKLVANFNQQREAVKSLSAALAEMRGKLSELKRGAATGEGVLGFSNKQLTAEIKKTTSAVGSLESKTQRAVASLRNSAGALEAVGVNTRELSSSTAQLNAQTARTRSLLDASNGALDRYSEAVKEVAAANSAAVTREREIAEEARRRTAIEVQESEKRIAQNRREIAEKAQRAERLRQAVAVFSSPAASEAERQAAADARIAGINERLVGVLGRKTAQQRAALGVTAAGTAATEKDTAATRANTAAKEGYTGATRRAAAAQGLFADTGRKSLSVYQRLRGQILQVSATYLGLYQAVALLQSSIETDQKRQAIRTQLLVVEGNNAARAADTYNFLRQEADRLGLQFDALAKNYANYAISAKAAGLTTLQIRETFIQTATSVTGLRLSAEDAEGVFRAMTQIMSKAKVQAEELRGQLGDRLPGAVAAFAKANNIALTDLDKMLKEGKVGVQELVNFIGQYAKQFDQTLPRTTSTLLADLNRLKNAYGDFLELLAQGETGTALQKAIQDLRVFFQSTDGRKFAEELSSAFAQVIEVLRLVIKHFGTFVTLVKLFIGLQLAKALVSTAGSIITFASGLRTAGTAFLAFRTGALAAAAGTGTLTVAMRAFILTTGPVGILLAAFSAALLYLATTQDKAGKAATAHAETVDQLKVAMKGDTRAAVDLANATYNKASADLAAARAALKHAQAQNALHLEQTRNPLTARAALNRAPADATNELPGLVQQLEKQEKELRDLRAEALRNHMRFLKDQAELATEESNIQSPVSTEDDDSAAKKAEREREELARKREQIEEQVANAIKAIDRDLLQSQQKTLEERLKLIDFDIDARIEELNKLKAEAAEVGQTGEVAALDSAVKRLNILREIEKVEETKRFNQEKIQENEQKINDLLAQRQQIIETATILEQAGLITRTEAQARIEEANNRILPQLTEMVRLAQKFITALGSSPEAAAAQVALDNIKAKIEATKVELTATQRAWMNLGTTLAGGIVDTIGVLAKGLAGAITGANSLADAFKGARDAFLNFAADFLVQIGQMILKAILLRALQNFLTGSKGGFFDAVVGAFSQHTGGITGRDGKPRLVPAEAFIGARRFHDGGMPGLKSNEVPTILKKGEEVLTEDDARHANNIGAGGGAGSMVDMTVNNLIDPVDMLRAAAATPAGKKILFNVISSDRSTYRQVFSTP